MNGFSYDALLTFLPVQLRGNQMRPYYLPLTTTAALTGGGTATLTTPLNNVAAFLLLGITGRVYEAASPQTSVADPGLTIDLGFSSGDDATFGPVPLGSLVDIPASPNSNPGGLTIPRLVAGGSNIQVVLANYTGTDYLVRLGLDGVNVYSS